MHRCVDVLRFFLIATLMPGCALLLLPKPSTPMFSPVSFVLLLTNSLHASLTKQDIPNVASLLDVFNRDLVARCITSFTNKLAAQVAVLPVDEGVLDTAAATARAQALSMFRSSLLGARRGPRGTAGMCVAVYSAVHRFK